ncbi:MAG: cation transporter, partial [bacterium]|nr:cation transporter [bacterium]
MNAAKRDEMSERGTGKQRHRDYVRRVRAASALLNGPRRLEEISEHYYSHFRFLGLFRRAGREAHAQTASISERLDALLALGWVVREDERYVLTPLGREEVGKRLSELGETGTRMRRFLQPESVAKVTVAVHFGLAALKVPAGLISGSVGLLNDAADTFLDGLSGSLVYFGLRLNKERAVNVILVVFMLGTGALTLYQAIRRFFVSTELDIDWFTFLAVLLSAAFSLGLWVYQHYVGLQSGHLALITQSVDSRNHVLVAFGVTVGLVASLLQFSLLDTLVGLAVALLILKS